MNSNSLIHYASPIGRLLGFAAFLLATGQVQAAGFYLQEVGTPHSLGTAGVANPTNIDSADASWANPAGMAFIQQDQFYAGVQAVLPSMEFDSSVAEAGGGDGGNAGNAVLVPSLFYVHRYSDQVSFGLSLAGTMGGGVDYGSNFVGRYSTISAELSAIGLSPSVAYKVSDDFSIGAGVSILYTLFEQEIGINPIFVPTVSGGDGRLSIEDADDIGFQPFFSLNYRPADKLLLSLVYRAEMDVELSGDVKVKNVGLPIGADSIDVDWTNPQWLELGVRYELSDQDALHFNAGWQDWSKFSNNRLAFDGGALNLVAEIDRNYKDTWHAGVAYSHRTGKGSGYSLGMSYDSSPVDDEDRTFDLPFDEIFKLSGGYFWQGDRDLDFAVGATLYLVGEAPIDQISQRVRAKGEFDENLILFVGGTLRYVF
jgi:long-chain fatty acid transport protein